jgi:hypothetical protein
LVGAGEATDEGDARAGEEVGIAHGGRRAGDRGAKGSEGAIFRVWGGVSTMGEVRSITRTVGN